MELHIVNIHYTYLTLEEGKVKEKKNKLGTFPIQVAFPVLFCAYVLTYLLPRLLIHHGSISVAPRFGHGAAPD